MSQPLLIEHHDGVDWVTLNRPESLNALDPAMIDALNTYFQGLQRNRDTRVVVLKGSRKVGEREVEGLTRDELRKMIVEGI